MLPKILFIMQLPPPVHGAAMINNTIAESTLINSKFDCDYINLTTATDVNDIGKSGIKKYIKSFGIYFKVFSKALFNRYNLIYITLSPHGIAFYKDALLAITLKFFGFKLVYHLHGKGIKQELAKSHIKAKTYRQVFKNTFVIHLSKLLYFDIENIINEENVKYVANGINSDESFDLTNKPKGNKILYLSNMQESKGSFVLLQSAKILKDKNVDFHIDFVGKWHNDPKFKEKWMNFYKENNLQDQVTYHGAKYDSEKTKYLIEANIFVLPTNNDCFPISILEAMSFGTPVLSTKEGAIPEIINNNENGLIIKKNNPEDLAQKVEYMLVNEKLRIEFGQNAHKKFHEKYSIENFENNFCKTLSSILGGYRTN